MLRVLSLISAACLVAASVAGCGTKETPANRPTAAAPRPAAEVAKPVGTETVTFHIPEMSERLKLL